MNGNENLKLSLRIKGLKAAFASCKEFSKGDLTQNLHKAAFVKAFEFTYELAWKTMKAFAEDKGLRAPSPRDAMSAALQLQIISDESLWLQMKDDRNTTAHTYSVDYLPEMLARMKSQYVPAFESLIETFTTMVEKE